MLCCLLPQFVAICCSVDCVQFFFYVGFPLSLNHRLLRIQWAQQHSVWRTQWQCIAFSDVSRCNLYYNDGRVCVRYLLLQYAIQRQTAQTLGNMMWGTIGYYIRSRLVNITGTTTVIVTYGRFRSQRFSLFFDAFWVLYFSRIVPTYMFLRLHKPSSAHNRLRFYHGQHIPRICLS